MQKISDGGTEGKAHSVQYSQGKGICVRLTHCSRDTREGQTQGWAKEKPHRWGVKGTTGLPVGLPLGPFLTLDLELGSMGILPGAPAKGGPSNTQRGLSPA